jgi:hypothetical protein
MTSLVETDGKDAPCIESLKLTEGRGGLLAGAAGDAGVTYVP